MRALHSFFVIAVATIAAAIWAAPGCGSSPTSNFGTGPDNDAGNGGGDGACDPSVDFCGPGAEAGEAAPPCVGLACQVVNCGNGTSTTVSGIVYDPAGRNPLYNVFVYVPNAPLADIPSGPVCTSCQAPASGSPLPGGVQTDPTGKFTVTDVPVGSNIPLVMQLGKWRREITIPAVTQCVDNHVGKQSAGLETLTRMPAKQHEGGPADNIPKIATSTGSCDTLESLLAKIGIDPSEFSSPTGRVHVYQGSGGTAQSYSVPSANLWGSLSELNKYDIVINSCECGPLTRNGAATTTMKAYVDGGGRLFGTHYHYNWFAGPSQLSGGEGPADYQSVAMWGNGGPFAAAPWYIDTSFPKGVAFDKWIQNVFKANSPPPPGQINLVYSNNDVGNIVKPLSTRWIYYGDKTGSNYGTAYLSFNTPVKASVDKQCGRAVFSDLHVSSSGGGGTTLSQQEAALEFLFFDLSSCVQDDTKPPPPPPVN